MVEDQKLINLIDEKLFKTDNIDFNETDLILYNKHEPLNIDSENYNLNILNHLLCRLIKSYDLIPEDIENLNNKIKYLGYKIKMFDKKPDDLNLYGYIVFKKDEKWKEYFNILNKKDICLFIHYQNYQKPLNDYQSTFTIIQAKNNIYIQFVKLY